MNLPHSQQLEDGYCRAACPRQPGASVQMLMAAQGVQHDQTDLARVLGVRPRVGAAFPNVLRLASRLWRITCREGTAEDLLHALDDDLLPVLVVNTSQLPYWHYTTQHAVVWVAIGGSATEQLNMRIAVVHDPACPEPMRVSMGDVLLAWDEMDNFYALVQRA